LLRRVILVAQRPLVMNTSWLPASLFPGLEALELQDGSLWRTLGAHYGTKTRRADNTVELVTASADEARLLHLEPESPLLRLTGIVYGDGDRPLEHSIALWAANVRFHFPSLRD
jgi:GntR family transcriptional regulator